MIRLEACEEIIDASGVGPRIEALLPAGVRSRQLEVRTLLAGMCLALADGRPAHLTLVHQALTSLPEPDQRRLGVRADWKHGPHQLTFRQAEYTCSLIAAAVGKDEPDGLSSPELQAICDDLLEASVPREFKDASRSLAVDWTDLESFSRPPPHGTSDCAAHRDAAAWAILMRTAGASLVQDLHPHDHGPKGTHHGTIIANGNLYCPGTPARCWNSGPWPATATPGPDGRSPAPGEDRAGSQARRRVQHLSREYAVPERLRAKVKVAGRFWLG